MDLNNYANVMLKHELARVPGVSPVTFLGAEDFGVRIRLDLDKLAARKLTIEDVTRAVDSQDLGAKDGPPAGPGGTSHLQPNAQEARADRISSSRSRSRPAPMAACSACGT